MSTKKIEVYCYFNFIDGQFIRKNYPGWKANDDILVVVADTEKKEIIELYSATTVWDEHGNDVVGELNKIKVEDMNFLEKELIYYSHFEENLPDYLKEYVTTTYKPRVGMTFLNSLWLKYIEPLENFFYWLTSNRKWKQRLKFIKYKFNIK